MRWRVNPAAVAAVIAVVTVAGCAEVVNGSPQRTLPAVPDPDRSYGYVDNRCGLLTDASVQEVLGADHVVRPYSGAVCQYVLMRGAGPDVGGGTDPDVGAGAPPVTIDAIYSWFETGSLDRERALAGERGATVTDTDIERHKAFLARRDTTGVACSATAAAGAGVLSWWVQLRDQSTGDPCKEAEKLLSATLRSDL